MSVSYQNYGDFSTANRTAESRPYVRSVTP
jgi:Dullard-like phosphatase family protein